MVTCYLDPARIHDPAAQEIVRKEGVSYKAVTIGNPPEPTTCINYEDSHGVSHIDCNYDLVMASGSTGNPDYVTVHHEFASIAGVEARTNSFDSDFSISNQLSQFEHTEEVKFLGPKRESTPPADVVALLAVTLKQAQDRVTRNMMAILRAVAKQVMTRRLRTQFLVNTGTAAIISKPHQFASC